MIEIRQASHDDCPRIAEIQVAGWKAAYRGIPPDDFLNRLDRKSRVVTWEQFVRDRFGDLLVVQVDGALSGFCHLIPSRDCDGDRASEIAAIYIDPPVWRNGYGKTLIAEACKRSKEQNRGELTLWVLEENSVGRRFYEAMGFFPDGAMKTDQGPDCTLHEVRYRRNQHWTGS